MIGNDSESLISIRYNRYQEISSNDLLVNGIYHTIVGKARLAKVYANEVNNYPGNNTVFRRKFYLVDFEVNLNTK